MTKQKDTIKEGSLEDQEERKEAKIWVNTWGFASSLDFSKICIMVEAKFITLSAMVLNI